ncbi:MAG: hypothetical protein JSR91_26485 [Proteobacteria bacterium]|nr:hypothetical protein [Pseudomonadota bacterium]
MTMPSSTLPPATVATPQSPPAAAAPATAFDGSYTGSFIIYSTTSAATVVARAKIKVSHDHSSGSLTFEGSFRTGGGTISIDILPDGSVTGEGEATEPNGVHGKFGIRGHAEDRHLDIELTRSGEPPFNMTLRRKSQ